MSKLIKKREPWSRFALKALAALVIIGGTLGYAHARYTIGMDSQKIRCLDPYRVFVIDRWNLEPENGILMAFRSNELKPFYPDGTVVVKQIRGMPGDTIKVTTDATYINGGQISHGTAKLAEKLPRPAESYEREFTLADGEYFFMGWHEQSYDSRYWGVVRGNQLLGVAKPLM